MQGLELIVIVFGLFLGYWIVNHFLSGPPKPKQNASASGNNNSDKQFTEPPASSFSSPNEPEWYEVLNVSLNAQNNEIKRAYKVLMSQYHPDKVASLGEELRNLAEKKSKEITSAYRKAMQLHGEDV